MDILKPENLTPEVDAKIEALINDINAKDEGSFLTLIKDFWLVLLFIVIIWLLAFLIPFMPALTTYADTTASAAGQFGDQFGSVNALFSGLALAFVAITLHYQVTQLKLQRKEVSMQRLELMYQRFEMQNQVVELKAQNEEMKNTRLEFKNQRINSVFFSLLTLKKTAQASLNPLPYQIFMAIRKSSSISREPQNQEDFEFALSGTLLQADLNPTYLDAYGKSLLSIISVLKISELDSTSVASYVRILKYSFEHLEMMLIAYLLITNFSQELIQFAAEHRLLSDLDLSDPKLDIHPLILAYFKKSLASYLA